MKSINPATGEEIATHTELTEAQIDAALDRATATFATWRETDIAERTALLSDLADAYHDHRDRLARMATLEMGKTLKSALVEVDNADDSALRHWQHHIGQLGDGGEVPDWSAPRYQAWRLRERVELNPGSLGGPAFHLSLSPEADALPAWTAGDIAEMIAGQGIPGSVSTFASPVDAWQATRERVGADDRIVVFGSFLTVAEVMREYARSPLPSKG